jgi:hypothetical protein
MMRGLELAVTADACPTRQKIVRRPKLHQHPWWYHHRSFRSWRMWMDQQKRQQT